MDERYYKLCVRQDMLAKYCDENFSGAKKAVNELFDLNKKTNRNLSQRIGKLSLATIGISCSLLIAYSLIKELSNEVNELKKDIADLKSENDIKEYFTEEKGE